MKKLLLSLLFLPLFLIACTGDYQNSPTVGNSINSNQASFVSQTSVDSPSDIGTASAAEERTPLPVVTPDLSNDNYYTNSAGNEVHSPAYSDSVPSGASAIRGDGTYSFSQSRRGTCSHHGGVSEWLD